MNTARIASLEEVAKRSSTQEDFWLNLRDFLDAFYCAPGEAAIRDEPMILSARLPEGDRLDAYLAAAGEHLAREFHLVVPSWVQAPSRTLCLPYFAFDTYEARMFLLVDSPTAFRARNIFVSADALSRV